MVRRREEGFAGALPWTGARRTGSTGASQKGDPARETYPGPAAALRQRRTTAQLEQLLEERLTQLRADPPRGYPQ